MATNLIELIVSLRKLNPTFTDEIIRGHLINLGNPKEAVDDALRAISGGLATQAAVVDNTTIATNHEVIKSENVSKDIPSDIPKVAPIIREIPKEVITVKKPVASSGSYGYDGGASFSPPRKIKSQHHRIRNFFILIIFILSLILGSMLYLGTLTVNDFKNIKIDWSQVTNTEYLRKEGSVFLHEASVKLKKTYIAIKFKLTPKLVDLLGGPSIDKSVDIVFAENEDLVKEIHKVNKIRNVLNSYAGVYGSYPEEISELINVKPNINPVTLPLLEEDDIIDLFSNQVFTYKKDPKTGFNLAYNINIPKKVIESKLFYDLVDYRLIFNPKTNSSSYIPMLKYVNGLNTATRDVVSMEAIRVSALDINKNLIPDSLE
jgi:hypothetical protein